ncbi:MAG: PQQ-dependent sugar dehydrogenase [Chthoniobacterales bacterium]|nr:PQQ-dependent sugar dehydrogenase [Chthoniobacterales bacterium]
MPGAPSGQFNSGILVPNSNPFVGKPGVDEIYAYGFRNPFRFSFDPATDKLIVGDVGQNHVEEIDVVQAGKNYGWNKKEGSFLFHPANGSISPNPASNPALINPIAEYGHEDGTAVLGGFVYRGTALPAVVGKYLFAELSQDFSAPGGRLFFLDSLARNPVREFQLGNDDRELGLFIKGIGEDTEGEIYVLADSGIGPSATGGRVLKLVAAPPSPALLNLSTRLNVGTGENVLIGGFIVVGSTGKPGLLRGIGPSLSADGASIPGRITDPLLDLHDGSGGMIASNDDWVNSSDKQKIINTGVQPSDNKESALLRTLSPGAYTAVLRSANASNGVGLIERTNRAILAGKRRKHLYPRVCADRR